MFLSPNLRFVSIMGSRIIFASPSKWKNLQPWRATEENARRVASVSICARELQGALLCGRTKRHQNWICGYLSLVMLFMYILMVLQITLYTIFVKFWFLHSTTNFVHFYFILTFVRTIKACNNLFWIPTSE